MPIKIKRFGWNPDLPDQRDHVFSAPAPTLRALPSHVDLRSKCPPEIYYQGRHLHSCTGNAIAAAIEFDQMKQRVGHVFTPSRLFIYYNGRVIEDRVGFDAGMMIRNGIKSVAKLGAPPERDWPYDIRKFRRKPPAKAFADAAKHKIQEYQRLDRKLRQMKGCLASGYPFVFGFTVYESFESQHVKKTGKVRMPDLSSEYVLGGHAVLAVGYVDATRRFIVRNSWGRRWGMKGYFTIPYDYLLDSNLSDDFWTIRIVR